MSDGAIRVRASSWGSLFDCAHKWEGTHLIGLRNPAGPRMILGTAIHASTAAFDQGRLDRSGATADDVAGLLIDTLHKPGEEVDWSSDELSIREAERIGLSLHARYCVEVSPQFDYVAVEMETKPLTINCGDGITVMLTGTLDRSRIRRGSNGVGIADLKTGIRAVEKGAANTKGHAAQLGTYELLFEHTTEQPITEAADIIGLKTSGKPEIGVGQIRNARELMVGTAEKPGLIEFAAAMFRTGLFPPNPSSHLCSEKYCARWNSCPYHY